MNQSLWERFCWWLCEKLGHPFPVKGWIFEGYYHRDCRFCGRIVSEKCTETKDNHHE